MRHRFETFDGCLRFRIFFRLQRPVVFERSVVDPRVARSYAAFWIVAWAAWQARGPDVMCSYRRTLAHV